MLMQNIMTKYRQYFINKYKISAQLFDDRYVTLAILSDKDLLNVSRDIHVNPHRWIDCPNSSLRAYLYDDTPSWVNKSHIAKLCGSSVKYLEFLNDYKK